MPETVLNGDASRSPVFPTGDAVPDDLEELDEPGGELDELDALDHQLIAQLRLRVRCARAQQLGRRAVGLPATALAQENAMLRQYVSRLGPGGAGIALAILALSAPAAHSLPADPAR
ncbi:hypothetical protein P3T36_001204 [Kitasatospora sp. MAP12-15]|uniref:hypothetical protein n=1 Tax=unclassified Kitasatospora TaxID=2633591 RepID=UPI002474452A|nr:hypothetical protein [Kitasatospora sp. MAP12-44]MDH6114853.1 hypothetical protein [Kitasatospora sp. MAP12-44]